MSNIHIKHHHSLKHHETRERVDQIARHLKRKYRVDYTWHGNQLHSRHKGASVAVYLDDGYIELKVKLGLLFAPMKGRIERAIRKNLHSVIGDRENVPARMILNEKV